MKKAIAILLSMCMLFSLTFSLAENDDFRITDADGREVAGTQGVYTITQAGEYTVTGALSEGQIRVEAPEGAEVRLILAGASISSSTSAPIVIASADEVTIKSEADTENFISDLRTGTPGEDEETGAIDAACDLNLTGKGSLIIVSTFDKGVRTKDDLSIKNVTLTVTSAGAALKGNDGVKIESGTLDLTAEGADGIKTGNNSISSSGKQKGNILIKDGSITIHAGQDGLDAANDAEISGGTMIITAAGDGIHADDELRISGGKIQVLDSREGLEGNVITLAGGEVSIYAEDDGINASSGNETPLINITGGVLEVTTPSGDTDGIDSNGDIVMTGGTVLVRGGAAMGNMAGSVDVDGTITVTGGTIIAIGGICETPEDGSVCTYISSGTSFAAGDYTLAAENGDIIGAFTLADSYSSVWIASDQISIGESYTLTRDGEEVLAWTQSAATEGSAGIGWGNGGGFGGPGNIPGGEFSGEPPEGFDGDFDRAFPGPFGGGPGGEFEGDFGNPPGNFEEPGNDNAVRKADETASEGE